MQKQQAMLVTFGSGSIAGFDDEPKLFLMFWYEKWLLDFGMQPTNIMVTKTVISWYNNVGHEESQAYGKYRAYIFQLNNGSLYTSEPGHELD